MINFNAYKKYKDYGTNFFYKLLKDLGEEATNFTPPIIFFRFDEIENINGYYDGENSINIININLLSDHEIKRTIRHETIHYTLKKLQIPSKDSDTEFMNIAITYNCYPKEYLRKYFNK